MQGSDTQGRAPRAIDYRDLIGNSSIAQLTERTRHARLDLAAIEARAIRAESYGPRQVHKMRARFGRRWRFSGVTVPAGTLAEVRATLYEYSDLRIGKRIERAVIDHHMTQRDARMALAGLAAWGRTIRVSETESRVVVDDAQTQAINAQATAHAREQQRQRAKVQVIFDAARVSTGLVVWHRTDGHMRHCACHGCGRLDKAIRALGNFIRF